MGLNIGNRAIEAARTLNNNSDWRALREALCEQSRQKMNAALEALPGMRDDAIGYARALRDVYVAMESASTSVSHSQVNKPGPEKPNVAR